MIKIVTDPRDIWQSVYDSSDRTIRVKTLGSYSVAVKDKKRGSDCSGSDGEANRVLTLSNTDSTEAVIVAVNGAVWIEDTDYTVSHLAASSTITFINRIADAMHIEVIYFA